MGEAFITRRGERVKRGTATATNTSLTIPDLIGAKNAVIWFNGYLKGSSYRYVSSIDIRDGDIYCVTCADSSGTFSYTDMFEFDIATGKIYIPNTYNLYFFAISTPYDYVVY